MKMSRSGQYPSYWGNLGSNDDIRTPATPMKKEKYVTSAPCRAIVYAVLAHFFFVYAYMNPDGGSCFATKSSKVGRSEVPHSVTATAAA